jgi:hypothetical protein
MSRIRNTDEKARFLGAMGEKGTLKYSGVLVSALNTVWHTLVCPSIILLNWVYVICIGTATDTLGGFI